MAKDVDSFTHKGSHYTKFTLVLRVWAEENTSQESYLLYGGIIESSTSYNGKEWLPQCNRTIVEKKPKHFPKKNKYIWVWSQNLARKKKSFWNFPEQITKSFRLSKVKNFWHLNFQMFDINLNISEFFLMNFGLFKLNISMFFLTNFRASSQNFWDFFSCKC